MVEYTMMKKKKKKGEEIGETSEWESGRTESSTSHRWWRKRQDWEGRSRRSFVFLCLGGGAFLSFFLCQTSQGQETST